MRPDNALKLSEALFQRWKDSSTNRGRQARLAAMGLRSLAEQATALDKDNLELSRLADKLRKEIFDMELDYLKVKTRLDRLQGGTIL